MAQRYVPFAMAPMAPPGMPPTLTGVENRPPVPIPQLLPSLPAQPPQTAVGGAMPQSPQEAQDLATSGRSYAALLEATGVLPARRAVIAAEEGRPVLAAGNAAVAMLPFRLGPALKLLGGAYGGALARDLGLFDTTAQAGGDQPAGPNPDVVRRIQADVDRLSRAAEDARLRREANRPDSRAPTPGKDPKYTAADKELKALNSQLNAARKLLQAEMEKGTPEYRRREAGQKEYERAVKRAESMRDEELAQRRPEFGETNVGQLYEATSGVTPAVVGAGTAGLARLLGQGPLRAVIGGTMAGAVTPNAPLVHEMMGPPFNRERVAFETFARELPPTHPRRQEWMEYARGLPEYNVRRKTATEDFFNLRKAFERTLFGSLEGATGGLVGLDFGDLARMAGRMRRGGSSPAGPSPGSPPPLPGQPPAGPIGPPAGPVQPPFGFVPPVARLGNQRPGQPLPPEPPPPAPAAVGAPPRPMPPGAFQARNGRWMVMTPRGPRFISDP